MPCRHSWLGSFVGIVVLVMSACGGKSEGAPGDGLGGQTAQGGSTSTESSVGAGGSTPGTSTAGGVGGTTTGMGPLRVACWIVASKMCREIYENAEPLDAQRCGTGEQALETPCPLENAIGYCQLSGLDEIPDYVNRKYFYVGTILNGAALTGAEPTPMIDCERRSNQDWHSLP